MGNVEGTIWKSFLWRRREEQVNSAEEAVKRS